MPDFSGLNWWQGLLALLVIAIGGGGGVAGFKALLDYLFRSKKLEGDYEQGEVGRMAERLERHEEQIEELHRSHVQKSQALSSAETRADLLKEKATRYQEECERLQGELETLRSDFAERGRRLFEEQRQRQQDLRRWRIYEERIRTLRQQLISHDIEPNAPAPGKGVSAD